MIAALQLFIAFMIAWRAKAEGALWDKTGFSLLAATSGLMSARRITAAMDSHVTADRIVLPTIITFVMLAAAICFVLQAMDRMRTGTPPVTWRRVMWPSTLFTVAVLAGEVPAQEARRYTLPPAMPYHECLQEAVGGRRPVEAIAATGRHIERGIERLALLAVCEGPEGEAARAQLEALKKLCVYMTEGNRNAR